METEIPQKLEGRTIVGKIIERIAPRIGAKVLFDEWGFAGQITFANGERALFKGSSIGLNTIAAADIAKDKDYSNFFMKSMGYKTIPGEKFFSDKWADTIKSDQKLDKALKYAKKMGFPLIVKPNSGSQGRGVARVNNEEEFMRAMKTIFEMDKIALVQQLVFGHDYRVVVLGDRVISAYERIPLNVIGDGKKTVFGLLEEKQLHFIDIGRDTNIKFDDERIPETLALQGLTYFSVPENGQKIMLLSNANLSSGGDAVDVTETIHDTVKDLSIRLTKDMSLKLCGVDLMIPGGALIPLGEHHITEINAAPGLDHYANIGSEQEQVVEDMYLEVLKSMQNLK